MLNERELIFNYLSDTLWRLGLESSLDWYVYSALVDYWGNNEQS